jgi:hypothetical protein
VSERVELLSCVHSITFSFLDLYHGRPCVWLSILALLVDWDASSYLRQVFPHDVVDLSTAPAVPRGTFEHVMQSHVMICIQLYYSSTTVPGYHDTKFIILDYSCTMVLLTTRSVDLTFKFSIVYTYMFECTAMPT